MAGLVLVEIEMAGSMLVEIEMAGSVLVEIANSNPIPPSVFLWEECGIIS